MELTFDQWNQELVDVLTARALPLPSSETAQRYYDNGQSPIDAAEEWSRTSMVNTLSENADGGTISDLEDTKATEKTDAPADEDLEKEKSGVAGENNYTAEEGAASDVAGTGDANPSAPTAPGEEVPAPVEEQAAIQPPPPPPTQAG